MPSMSPTGRFPQVNLGRSLCGHCCCFRSTSIARLGHSSSAQLANYSYLDGAKRPMCPYELGPVIQPAPMARPLTNSCQAVDKHTMLKSTGEPEGSCIQGEPDALSLMRSLIEHCLA